LRSHPWGSKIIIIEKGEFYDQVVLFSSFYMPFFDCMGKLPALSFFTPRCSRSLRVERGFRRGRWSRDGVVTRDKAVVFYTLDGMTSARFIIFVEVKGLGVNGGALEEKKETVLKGRYRIMGVLGREAMGTPQYMSPCSTRCWGGAATPSRRIRHRRRGAGRNISQVIAGEKRSMPRGVDPRTRKRVDGTGQERKSRGRNRRREVKYLLRVVTCGGKLGSAAALCLC